MKYWRGYLTAAIFGFFTWGLMEFAKTHPLITDMVYPYVSRMYLTMMAEWSGSVDFLLWQLVAVVLGVVALATLVLMVVLKWNPIQWFGWVIAAASIVVFLHTGFYGLSTYAGPLADDIRLNVTEYTESELTAATTYFRDRANELADQLNRDANDDLIYSSFEDLANRAGEGYQTLTYEESGSVFAGSMVPVKELGWADMYSSMGITGFTFGITGEAAVNPQIPVVSLPFTMCHEMAHRMSIANERDANFAAFLACNANTSLEFRYSAYFMAYRYCYNALASVNPQAAQQVKAGNGDLLFHDMDQYRIFFETNKDEQATDFATTVNDTYIKASGDEEGVMSYGNVVDLLVSWHIQEFVLPLYEEEEEVFDPFDKSQVDVSDLTGAED